MTAIRTETLRAHLAATLKLGLPLVGVHLAQIAITTTDTVMIGWLGPRELAASVLGAQVFFIALMFGSGFALAIMPLVAQAAARDDARGVRRSARMGMWIVIAYAALIMIPLWHLESILLYLGQDPGVSQMAQGYSRIMQWGLAPSLLVMALRSVLAALERPRVVLIATIAAALLNALLNWVLIFGNLGFPALGLTGAAIASLSSASLSFLIVGAYSALAGPMRGFEFYVRFWRPDWPALAELIQLGWPISLTVVAEVGLFSASALMMGWIGVNELAAHGIALQLAALSFMIPLGFASAATVRAGRAIGQANGDGLRKTGNAVYLIGGGVAAFAALLFIVFPGPLVWLFLETETAETVAVAALAAAFLKIAAAFQLVDAVQAIAAGLLRGMKDTTVPMAMAIFSYWVAGLPLGYLLAFRLGWGGAGIWTGLAGGLAFAAILLTLRFYRRAATV